MAKSIKLKLLESVKGDVKQNHRTLYAGGLSKGHNNNIEHQLSGPLLLILQAQMRLVATVNVTISRCDCDCLQLLLHLLVTTSLECLGGC